MWDARDNAPADLTRTDTNAERQSMATIHRMHRMHRSTLTLCFVAAGKQRDNKSVVTRIALPRVQSSDTVSVNESQAAFGVK
jgi:hypothetical protein